MTYALVAILWNLVLAYLISLYSFVLAIGFFCFSVGFQFGKWFGKDQKEEEFIAREEIIRAECERPNH